MSNVTPSAMPKHVAPKHVAPQHVVPLASCVTRIHCTSMDPTLAQQVIDALAKNEARTGGVTITVGRPV